MSEEPLIKEVAASQQVRGRILWREGECLVAARGSRLYLSRDGGRRWKGGPRFPLGYFGMTLAAFSLTRRLLRWDIHCAARLSGYKIIFSAFNQFFLWDIKQSTMETRSRWYGRSRPLNLCFDGVKLYWGEYRANPGRAPIAIWGSDNAARHWEMVYVFNRIRHIHGVFHDPYANAMWVTTGDNDKESGIWVTTDGFRTLEKVLWGNQQLRSIQLLFTRKFVFFGSDTPLESNHIYRMNKASGKTERLQEVGSSVFWGCKVGEYLFFSTAVEPSTVNKCRNACIWGSRDGETWKCIVRFRKDIWPKKLFQYGQILFPAGENDTEYLWFTPLATEKSMTVQRLDVREVF